MVRFIYVRKVLLVTENSTYSTLEKALSGKKMIPGGFAAMKGLDKVLEELKLYVKRYIDTQVPGYIASIDMISIRETGKKIIDLLFESPSKAYQILKSYYGSELTADFAMLNLFLKPIAIKLESVGMEEQLLVLAKQGKDGEFLELIFRKLSRE